MGGGGGCSAEPRRCGLLESRGGSVGRDELPRCGVVSAGGALGPPAELGAVVVGEFCPFAGRLLRRGGISVELVGRIWRERNGGVPQ